MSKDNVIRFEKPSEFQDALTELLREGAQDLIRQAVETELQDFLKKYHNLENDKGHRQVVRNGYLPEREIQTGIGPVPLKVPRVRDRSGQGIKFESALLPKYLRRTKSIEEMLPWLYLKGVSTGDFSSALESLLGSQAKGLSASTITRLKSTWKKDYKKWSERDLSGKQYVYVWADGVYFEARMEEKQCMLVLIGADKDGRKELLGLCDGYRESKQSWKELMLGLKKQGLKLAPELAVGDGALGFWAALREVFNRQTKEQRCWVHKTANILNKLPKSLQPKAKQRIHDIWMAESREKAEEAFDLFIETYEAKYPKAVECLFKDRDVLLTFYDFPAEHWAHIRTTNPIESTFATVRLRTNKTRGCLSRQTAFSMVFKLMQTAQRQWRRLRGYQLMADVVEGIEFKDGIRVTKKAA